MNPARSFGPDLALNRFDHLWVYWAGPAAGATIAVGIAWLLRGPGATPAAPPRHAARSTNHQRVRAEAPGLAPAPRAADSCCRNGANRVAQPLLGGVVIEARVPEHEVLKRFELDRRRNDGELRIVDISVDESLVQRRNQVRAR